MASGFPLKYGGVLIRNYSVTLGPGIMWCFCMDTQYNSGWLSGYQIVPRICILWNSTSKYRQAHQSMPPAMVKAPHTIEALHIFKNTWHRITL
jgi:hypothetical protein